MMDISFWLLVGVVCLLVLFLWKQNHVVRVLNQKLEESQKSPAWNMIQQELINLRGQTQNSLLEVTKQVNERLSETTKQVNERLKDNAQALQQTQDSVGRRLDQIPKAVGDLQNALGKLEQANKQILGEIKEMESLKDILKPPKLRGGMGETLLENIIRQIFPSEDYYGFQHAFKDGEIVDAIVRFPKSGLVPIDAKFPLENFKKMTEASGEQEKKEASREFGRNVKKHIDDISKKYIRTDEGTLNFALMYVPAENIYYEIIARDDGEDSLLPYAFKKRVFPVSPHTFYAFLFTLAQWVGVMRFEEKAKHVWADLARIVKDFERFGEDFEVLGKHLKNAQEKYTDADKRLNKLETKLVSIQEGESPQIAAEEPARLEAPVA